MGLVIHDLNEDKWDKISRQYAGWSVISDRGTIHPCAGCFGCWNKTPGQCVIKDGYERMGELIHAADEVVVISRLTYGGFSGFVKNVFDRSLGYVLPQLQTVNGETHHQKRYDEDKPFTFVFYGNTISDREKACAKRYVKAVCANTRGHVKDVLFQECGEPDLKAADGTGRREERQKDDGHSGSSGRVLLINASMRSVSGNSAALARQLAKQLRSDTEIAALKDFRDKPSGLVRRTEEASAIVLCMPLYVDGLPSQLIRFMETMRNTYSGEPKRVYVIANMGLSESRQLRNLFSSVKLWCGRMGFTYSGGLGLSEGELIGAMMPYLPFGFWVTKTIAAGMKQLTKAIDGGTRIKTVLAEPFLFPRPLYLFIANKNWDHTAKRYGLSHQDLYRRIEQ